MFPNVKGNLPFKWLLFKKSHSMCVYFHGSSWWWHTFYLPAHFTNIITHPFIDY